MATNWKIDPKEVLAAYENRCGRQFQASVTSYELDDVVVFDPRDDSEAVAIASIKTDLGLSRSSNKSQDIKGVQVIISLDKGGFSISPAELIRISCDLTHRTDLNHKVGSAEMGHLRQAVSTAIESWLHTVKTVLAGELEGKIAELYPEEGQPPQKAVIDNEFKKSEFLASLRETSYDPQWAKNHLVERGHSLDTQASRYVDARVAMIRSAEEIAV